MTKEEMTFRIGTVFECWLIVREETERAQDDMLTVTDLGLFYRLQKVRDTLDAVAQRFVKGPSPLPIQNPYLAERLQIGEVFDLADTELRLLCDCLGHTLAAFEGWATSGTLILAAPAMARHYADKANACRALLAKLRQALDSNAASN